MIFVEVPLRRIEDEIQALEKALSAAPDAPLLEGALQALRWLLHDAEAPSGCQRNSQQS